MNPDPSDGFALEDLYPDVEDQKIHALPKGESWEKIQKILLGTFDVVREYHPNGQLETVLTKRDGQRNGVYRYFDKDGNLIVESHYKKDQLHGKQVSNLSHGGSTTSWWKDGKQHGPEIYLSGVGEIECVFNYQDGKMHGEEKWYIRGKLRILATHENGFVKTTKSWTREGDLLLNNVY